MAAKLEGSDLTRCTICLENYNIPKKLPCLHAFCESCIESHISTTATGNSKDTISCPVCRTAVSAPFVGCSPQQWVKELPVDNLAVGLMEQRKIEREEKQCMSCERLGKTSTASFICVECSDVLCESCQRYHKANKFTSNHKIVSVGNISEVEKSLNLFRIQCMDHGEDVKLYCRDHDVPCCSLCVSVEHRKCQEVVTITQAAKGFMGSGLPKKLQTSLADIEEDAKTVIGHNKRCEEQLDAQYDKALTNLDTFCDDLKTKIDAFKDKRKDELAKLLYANKDQTEKNAMMLENLVKKTSNEREILDVSLRKATEVQAMIETKRVQGKQENHMKTLIQTVENSFDYELLFNSNIAVDEIVQSLEDKCIFSNTKSSVDLDLKLVTPMKLKLKSRINTGCQVLDCFCKGYGDLVIQQPYNYGYNNYTVLVYDQNGTNTTGFTPTYSQSYGYYNGQLSGNDSEMIYILGPYGIIEYLNYSGGQNKILNVNCNECIDAVYSNNELIILLFQNRIDIIRQDGTTFVTFKANNPRHPCIDSNSRLLYVEENKILCKTMDGNDIDIKKPDVMDIGGMAVDGKGNIFVSLQTKNTVSRIAGKTGSITDVLGPTDGLVNPSRLCISKDGKVLYVVNDSNQEILIFHDSK